jgi:HK97 family phage portal protein
MNIQLGPYSLSLTRTKSELRSPIVISTGIDSSFNRIMHNMHDSPTLNMNFIRETVSACMHARSEAIGRGRFQAYHLRRGTAGVQTKVILPPTHPLEAILTSPNPLFDMTDLLELTTQWLDATGNALLLKVRNMREEVIELWPIAALSFQIEKGADEMPAYYRFLPSDTRIPAQDIIHIRRADIRTAPFYGHAILSDILDTAKADTAIRLFQQRFFENDAMPRAVLKFPKGVLLTQDQMNEIRAAWEAKYGGVTNAGKLGILPDGGDVEVLSSLTKELDFAQSKRDLRDAIREAFKVPKIVLGDVESVNLSNAETSYYVFMRDVVDYSLSKIARALTRSLAKEFSPDITIEHDNVVPESEDRFLGRLRELKHCLTLDEQRAFLGLGPMPAGNGALLSLLPNS